MDATRAEPGLSRERNEGGMGLPHFPKKRGEWRKPALKSEEYPEKPALNGGRHENRWSSLRGTLRLHGGEMQAL